MQVPGLGGVFAEAGTPESRYLVDAYGGRPQVLAVPAVETQRDIPEVGAFTNGGRANLQLPGPRQEKMGVH